MTDNIDKAWEYFLKDNLQAAWDLVSDDFQLETCSDFSLLNLMLYLNLAENPQESLAICQRYISLAKSQKDLENEHIGLHQLAMVYRESGQYELALETIESEHAIIVAYFPEDQLKLSVNNYEQGFLRFKLKRYDDAIGYLKMSLEQAQKTDDVIAQAFEDLVLEAGAPEGAFKNLFVSYDQVNTIIADKRVAGVCLTGSERGGASVAEAAGRHLKKSSLELGGNDAFIILEDADFDLLKETIFFARLYNAGQVCTSSKRFIVVGEDHYKKYVNMVVETFKTAKWGDPMEADTSLAPLSSAAAKEDVLSQIKLAVDNGATVEYGNEAIDHPGNFVMPTVLTNITKENPIYNQEIFGPVASIYKVDTEEEAIELANDSSYGRELSELGFATFLNEHLIYTPKR